MDTKNNDLSKRPNLLKQISILLAWIGGSAGSISLTLTVLGFLVVHAYLERLGVPRTLYDATTTEYIASGGKFIMGLIPIGAIGFFHLLMNCWFVAILISIIVGLSWFLKWSRKGRLLSFTIFFAVWLPLVFLSFNDSANPLCLSPKSAVALLTLTTITAFVYFFFELPVLTGTRKNKAIEINSVGFRKYVFFMPFFVLLVCSIVSLPYVHGRYWVEPIYPTVEFLGEDRTFFEELASDSQSEGDNQVNTWKLIQIGKEKAILRHVNDKRIYVVPKDKINNFRILLQE